jgi:exodeoxyribonuclease-1
VDTISDKTIYWYDFETFGVNPRRDRASQFAGIRTDEDLNIIGKPLVLFCKPADDFLPEPMACLVTGISPQKAKAEGVVETEFIRQIHYELSQPGTCVAGYNSIRFDDELTRQLLYRNFYDPYEREWKGGNSRWDIIDMVRLCAAIRPSGINWPKKDDGSNSFKLDELTVANGIEHTEAHDALADVIATIELAKLIKQHQPKLYNYVYQLRSKKKVQMEIDLVTQKPVLHISMMYPAKQGCLALVMPLCAHPSNSNGVIVYDLRESPDDWLSLSTEEMRARLYAPKEQLDTGTRRVPFKTIHINKCPIVTSPAVLDPESAAAFGVDLESCRAHWQKLKESKGLVSKLSGVFKDEHITPEIDPDFMIYSGGFFTETDKNLMQTIRSTPAVDLARLDLPFRDRRLHEMLFRYRARNFPETLNRNEQADWEMYRQKRLHDPSSQSRYRIGLLEAKKRVNENPATEQFDVLLALEEYVASL